MANPMSNTNKMRLLLKTLREEAAKKGLVIADARFRKHSLKVTYKRPRSNRDHVIYYSRDMYDADRARVAELVSVAALVV